MDGVRIRYLRQNLGLSRAECAHAAFISPHHLSAVERGIRRMSPARAAKLAAVLKTNVADIRKGS